MSRILIVDDEESIRETLGAFLSNAGFEVELAEDVPTAQQRLKEGAFDVTVSDIIMPRVSGVELLKAIRQESPRVQVIMMTGQPTVETAGAAVRAGAFDYLIKPVSKESILRCVGNAAKLKATEDERLRLAEDNRRHQEDLERQHKQLQDNYGRLRELETLRDNLTHMIIHDLRAPLSVALGYVDLVKNNAASNLTSRAGGYLDTVLLNLCRLNDMIGSLLDISRLETGKMPLDRHACDMAVLAKSVMDSFDSLVGQRRLSLDSSPEPIMAICDKEVTRRVLGNLFQNALKFTPDDGCIRITVGRKDSMVRLEVSDNGTGIPPEFHTRIFEKFGQADRQTRQHSTGLGLTFCKLAVEAQGGQIGVESEVSKGSHFWFTLPAA
ncbi:MAG: hybrid sensor histidine kinase/response regulator [Verrucomicrobiia bacterium]